MQPFNGPVPDSYRFYSHLIIFVIKARQARQRIDEIFKPTIPTRQPLHKVVAVPKGAASANVLMCFVFHSHLRRCKL